uniref:Putative secreted peptide n=1 Tax=Anopheles braziliensis TaxID=58242 RepID=A0A2M3ZVY0_9DIPT
MPGIFGSLIISLSRLLYLVAFMFLYALLWSVHLFISQSRTFLLVQNHFILIFPSPHFMPRNAFIPVSISFLLFPFFANSTHLWNHHPLHVHIFS